MAGTVLSHAYIGGLGWFLMALTGLSNRILSATRIPRAHLHTPVFFFFDILLMGVYPTSALFGGVPGAAESSPRASPRKTGGAGVGSAHRGSSAGVNTIHRERS